MVIGFGVSGKAVMSLLRKRGIPALAVDKNPASGVPLDTADFPMEGILQVIVSPGILPTHPLVQKAQKLGLEVIGELEFALRSTTNQCIGVTGSNGKTTTTLLIAHALHSAGIPARAVGNVGTALSSYLLDPNPREILVIELSSFQLETMQSKKFDCAAYLNLTPNHLDRHASMLDYAMAKANIQNCLKPTGRLFISDQVWQTAQNHLQKDKIEIFPSSFAHKGNFLAEQNISGAHAVCNFFGVSSEMFIASLSTFKKPPHRIEWVAESAGIRYYNDSKATSVEAVLHAMSFFTGPVVLLVGGVDKGSTYLPWTTFQGKVKKIVAYGQASEIIQKELELFYELQRVSTLAEAIVAANKCAKTGDTVLLSPGCSSYDQFHSYEHRGDEFKKLVRETIGVHL
ncbi:MAG TPA: UDP-N-acetylmuramoyl-L-alanine--D-glutamate ligase [Chlamydiales bacterium]|nr:UDP-N-acetylmuramoyl-L-alanine--D-glutamate ligase [Chlamydiales bacterium]